jgi:zinc protease
MAAICNPANIDKVESAIADELDKLLKDGIGATELAEAKLAYLEQLKVDRANDGYLAAALADELFNGRTFVYYADLEQKVARLTLQEVNAAIRKHIAPRKLIIIHAGDFKKQARGTR